MISRLCLVAVCAFCASAAQAQSLEGTVRDVDGLGLPGAEVLVRAQQRGTVTDVDGRYRIENLTAGTDTVEVRFLGFERFSRAVALEKGETMRLDVTLAPASMALGDVVVTEDAAQARLTKRTQSATVLGDEELSKVRGQTLGETLDRLPGMATLSTGPSIAKPVVRGLHSERVVVFNAGVPQEGQQWGGEHAPEIDPFAPARIELVRGVAGVEYGVGAIGGVIRVVPRELPTQPGVGGEVQLNGFSNNRQGAASLLVEGASGRVRGLGGRVQTSLRRAGDAQAPHYGLVNSGFFERNALVAVGLHRARYGFDVQLSRFQTDLGVFQGAHVGGAEDLRLALASGQPFATGPFSYTIEAPKQAITHDLLSARGHARLPGGARLDAQYGIQKNHRQEFDRHYRGQVVPEGRVAFDLSLVSQTLALRYQARPVGRFVWSAGASGLNQGNRNGEAGQLIPNFRALTGGVFARGTYALGAVTLEAGARYDARHLEAYPRVRGAYEKTISRYEAFTGAAGVIWQFAPTWSAAANVGSAWRPPSVNELYSYGVHHGTAQFEVGDAALGRERGTGVDATLRHEGGRVHLEASVFATHFDGFLLLFPDTALVTTFRGTFPRYTHQQTDALLRGIDGQIGVHPVEAVSFEATLGIVRADDTRRDVPLYGMPADRLGLSATWHLPTMRAFRDGTLTVEGRFVARQDRVPEGVDFAPPPPGYKLFNAGLSGTLPFGGTPVSVTLSVENVLNTAYRDYLSRFRYFSDHPGRNVVVRLRVPFGRTVG